MYLTGVHNLTKALPLPSDLTSFFRSPICSKCNPALQLNLYRRSPKPLLPQLSPFISFKAGLSQLSPNIIRTMLFLYNIHSKFLFRKNLLLFLPDKKKNTIENQHFPTPPDKTDFSRVSSGCARPTTSHVFHRPPFSQSFKPVCRKPPFKLLLALLLPFPFMKLVEQPNATKRTQASCLKTSMPTLWIFLTFCLKDVLQLTSVPLVRGRQ